MSRSHANLWSTLFHRLMITLCHLPVHPRVICVMVQQSTVSTRVVFPGPFVSRTYSFSMSYAMIRGKLASLSRENNLDWPIVGTATSSEIVTKKCHCNKSVHDDGPVHVGRPWIWCCWEEHHHYIYRISDCGISGTALTLT